MSTGDIIRELRKSRGMTQEDLGKKIGVKKAAINKYETGVVDDLKQSTIIALSIALDVSPLAFLSNDYEKPYIESLIGEKYMQEMRLLEAYRGADDSAKEYALEILENHQKKTDTAIDQMA